jgi:fructose-1,6-bisphosphatase/sedoheptulose 1,7-bisphosphatase-like protein
VRLITDGDVAGALLAPRPTARGPAVGHRRHARGRDHRRRIKCMGCAMVGRCGRGDDGERKAPRSGLRRREDPTQDDLVKGDDAFFSATA